MVLFSFAPAALGQVTTAGLEMPGHPDCPGSAAGACGAPHIPGPTGSSVRHHLDQG